MLRNITEANHFIEIVENDGFIVPMIGYIRHYMLGYPTWEEREEAKRFIAEHGEDADIIIKQIRALESLPIRLSQGIPFVAIL